MTLALEGTGGGGAAIATLLNAEDMESRRYAAGAMANLLYRNVEHQAWVLSRPESLRCVRACLCQTQSRRRSVTQARRFLGALVASEDAETRRYAARAVANLSRSAAGREALTQHDDIVR